MTIAKLTSDDLREPDRENTILAKLNEALDGINGAAGGGTPGPGTFTTLSATGNCTLGDAATDSHVITGAVRVHNQANASGNGLWSSNGVAGQVATTTALNGEILAAATFDTTAGALASYGVLGQAFASRAAGANDLTNYGVYAKAANGQVNYAIYADGGDMRMGGAADKLGFHGTAPIAKQTGIAALTDNSGGTANDTLEAISAIFVQSEIRNNFADLAAKVNALRTALINLGLIGA